MNNVDDSTQTVYVMPGSGRYRYYHTREECDYLGSKPREWDLTDAKAFDLDPCSLCEAGGDKSAINNTTENSRSLRALLEDDESDIEYVNGGDLRDDSEPRGGDG